METKPPPCKHCGSWYTARVSENIRKCRTCNREYRLYPYTPPPPPEVRYIKPRPRPPEPARRGAPESTVAYFKRAHPQMMQSIQEAQEREYPGPTDK